MITQEVLDEMRKIFNMGEQQKKSIKPIIAKHLFHPPNSIFSLMSLHRQRATRKDLENEGQE